MLRLPHCSLAIPNPDVQLCVIANMKQLRYYALPLLLFLVSNKNRVVTKNAIAEHLSGDDAEVFDNFDFIYSHMKNLKRKLHEANCADYIKTIYGLGYKFEV